MAPVLSLHASKLRVFRVWVLGYLGFFRELSKSREVLGARPFCNHSQDGVEVIHREHALEGLQFRVWGLGFRV